VLREGKEAGQGARAGTAACTNAVWAYQEAGECRRFLAQSSPFLNRFTLRYQIPPTVAQRRSEWGGPGCRAAHAVWRECARRFWMVRIFTDASSLKLNSFHRIKSTASQWWKRRGGPGPHDRRQPRVRGRIGGWKAQAPDDKQLQGFQLSQVDFLSRHQINCVAVVKRRGGPGPHGRRQPRVRVRMDGWKALAG